MINLLIYSVMTTTNKVAIYGGYSNIVPISHF